PGGILGFHAPYYNDAALKARLEEAGTGVVMDDTRRNYALMVHNLVNWNVDPLVIGWMVFQGPQSTYDVVGANDHYLTRAGLPPSPANLWYTSKQDAVRNACIRLWSEYQRAEPLVLESSFPTEWIEDTGQNEFGEQLSGYVLGSG